MLCMYCGADRRRNCDFHEMTDTHPDMGMAPCEELDDAELFGDEDED